MSLRIILGTATGKNVLRFECKETRANEALQSYAPAFAEQRFAACKSAVRLPVTREDILIVIAMIPETRLFPFSESSAVTKSSTALSIHRNRTFRFG